MKFSPLSWFVVAVLASLVNAGPFRGLKSDRFKSLQQVQAEIAEQVAETVSAPIKIASNQIDLLFNVKPLSTCSNYENYVVNKTGNFCKDCTSVEGCAWCDSDSVCMAVSDVSTDCRVKHKSTTTEGTYYTEPSQCPAQLSGTVALIIVIVVIVVCCGGCFAAGAFFFCYQRGQSNKNFPVGQYNAGGVPVTGGPVAIEMTNYNGQQPQPGPGYAYATLQHPQPAYAPGYAYATPQQAQPMVSPGVVVYASEPHQKY